ncbi:calcium-binding protein [Sphingomicrobium sp. XHP0239]|uniref:calcium-binding protein n=1 Tax=Sphingomicrobium maritimum TaxID=3133972 RepID=UPI0031CCC0F1
MARLILVDEGEDVIVGGDVLVVGTTAANEVVTVVSGRVELNSSFNTGGDTINLPGSAADYQVSVLGTVVTLTGPDATLVIPAGAAATAITFDGGTDARTLTFDSDLNAFVLGDTVIGSSPSALPATDGGNGVATVTGFDGTQPIDGGDGYDVLEALVTGNVSVPDGSPVTGFERINLTAADGVTRFTFDLNDSNAPSQGELLVVDASAFEAGTQAFIFAYPDVSAYGLELIGGAGDDYLDTDNDRGGDIVRGGAGSDELWTGSSAADGRGDFAYGGEGDDFLNSNGSRINALFGGAGDDTFFVYNNAPTYADGGTGNDSFFFQGFLGADDRVIGGEGFDRLLLTTLASESQLAVVSGVESLEIEQDVSIILGGLFDASDFDAFAVFGDQGSEIDASGIGRALVLAGGVGDDEIVGTAFGDLIEGGEGADVLTGGQGADVFLFETLGASSGVAGRDTISDFEAGVDDIDVSGAFDGQSLTFLGNFASLAAANAAAPGSTGENEVRYAFYQTEDGGVLIFESDGDGLFTDADFQIFLSGESQFDAADLVAPTTASSGVVPDVMVAPVPDLGGLATEFG